MSAELSNSRSKLLLLANLSVQISYDDFDVVAWAAVVLTFQLRVECVLIIISASGVWAMDVDYAEVEEPAFDPQPAHSLVDRPPPDHAPLHIAHHYESCSQLVCVAAALVDGMITSKRSHH